MFVKIARLIRSLVRQGFDVVRYNPQQHLILPESLKVVGVTQNIVSGGPFDGMRLPDIDSWGQDRGSKLLSFYEQELHPTIREIIDWGPDKIINVGCAEGYYAVGLARLSPNALVVAYDTDETAQYACRRVKWRE
jgi:hypothetical protein